MNRKVIFLNSHPIQYFAPLYSFLNENSVETEAWYFSDFSIKGGKDKQFGVDIKWDIDLLAGYKSTFFRNQSLRPSLFKGFFGLINLGVLKALKKEKNAILVVHGWHYFSLMIVLLTGRLYGHTVCVRCDNPLKHEFKKKRIKRLLKQAFLKFILFKRIDYFLYIGKQNRKFYRYFGAKDHKLISCPYAVDNKRFRIAFETFDRLLLREKYDIKQNEKVIIFSGKYIAKKRPMDLLRAFSNLQNQNLKLIMVGEGELREEMENFIKSQNLSNVILTGFINQSLIPEYYAIGDLFVMCSYLGENWGLSVNEAMNFNLPLLISDYTGCVEDLVEEGSNGFVFKTGDYKELAKYIKEILIKKNLTNSPNSQAIVSNYSFEQIKDCLLHILNN
ncbi:glycosyltransferase family 4 protein [Zunongwangia profunda]|uniref:glycosyltransferase family 4 protein n=1 Tax=Zunongwangia profunda TaxID=398743 RepID=UPI00248DCE07|nr:glycosyltransferase family 4 protein [Zunongwangia profunda]|tara:strand:- start:4105 stop:5271 length:1167 start_codon:yes stop_codon:yes gene_type:complete